METRREHPRALLVRQVKRLSWWMKGKVIADTPENRQLQEIENDGHELTRHYKEE